MKGQYWHKIYGRVKLIWCIAILQRVHSASVSVDKQLISHIGKGILVFAAIAKEDTKEDVESMAAKVLKLRVWDDEEGGRVVATIH